MHGDNLLGSDRPEPALWLGSNPVLTLFLALPDVFLRRVIGGQGLPFLA